MQAGTAYHCAILEPEAFADRYIMAPATAPKKPTAAQWNAKKPSAAGIESMEWWTEFNDKAGDRIILSADDYEMYLAVGGKIRKHPELEKLLSDGLAEKCVFAEDPETGLLVKCKTDYYRQFTDLNVITDLKTTQDARPFAFQRDAYKFGYFQQAAFYSDVWKWADIVDEIHTWIITAFERDAPHAVKLYEVSGADIEFGRKQYRKALNTAAECHATDTWPAYDTEITPLHLPGYASVDD